MNIIAGMISPQMNWRRTSPRTARRSRSAKVRSTSRCRPKTLTSAWPVNVSSMWALSSPVRRHCCDELRCERFAIRAGDDHRQRHRDQRDQRQQRRDPEHHHQHADHGQQRGEQLAHRLLQRLADVVDVVGDPAEQLAARLLVEVAQRQPVQLVLDVARAAGSTVPLHDVVEQVALQPGQQRGDDVDAEHDQQHVPTAAKSMPWPGTTSIAATMSATGRRRARSPSTACSLVTPAGSRPPTTPAKIRSVAWPRILGPSTVSATLATREQRRRRSPWPARAPSGASSRLAEGLKSIAFWPTMPPPIGPRPGPPVRPRSARSPSACPARRPAGLAGGLVEPWCSCRLLLAELGRDDLPVGRAVGQQLVVGAAADDLRRRRARRSGRRRGWSRPAARRSRTVASRVTGRSAARSAASVARSSAENESSKR